MMVSGMVAGLGVPPAEEMDEQKKSFAGKGRWERIQRLIR